MHISKNGRKITAYTDLVSLKFSFLDSVDFILYLRDFWKNTEAKLKFVNLTGQFINTKDGKRFLLLPCMSP